MKQRAEEAGYSNLYSYLSVSKDLTPIDFFQMTSQGERKELIAELIHRGCTPSEVTLREAIIYQLHLKDLFERDSKVVSAGLSGGGK